MGRKKKEASAEQEKKKISLGDIVQEKKKQLKIPVFIGDNNNTVIFINVDRDPEDAKQNFLKKLDQYNPAKSQSDEPTPSEVQPAQLRQYQLNRAPANSNPTNDSPNASEYSPFRF